MKRTIRRAVAIICIIAVMCSIALVSTGALTRRLYGDVNGDDIISKADVTLIQQYLVGTVKLYEYQLIAADVDGDNDVNIKDATMITYLINGYIDSFPVGKYFLY